MINQGKLAVVQGMEVSEPFGCKLENKFPAPATTPRSTPGSTACTGSACASSRSRTSSTTRSPGSPATAAPPARSPTAATSSPPGKFFDLQDCNDPAYHDHAPTAVNYPHNEDAIIGNGLAALLPGGTPAGLSRRPGAATRAGLSPLGEHAIREIVDRGMIFDPDHMSVFGRQQALNLVESLDYSGIVSSHSWSTDDALPRIYALGGHDHALRRRAPPASSTSGSTCATSTARAAPSTSASATAPT